MASTIANRACGSSSSARLMMPPISLILIFLTLLYFLSSMRPGSTDIHILKKLLPAAIPNYSTFNTSTTSSSTCRRSTSTEAVGAPNPSPADPPAFRLFIGILTLPDRYWQRNVLRLSYGTQAPPPDVHVDVKFVFCSLDKEEQRVLISLEIIRFEDIVILNCTENMDNGKTFVYFSSLPELFTRSDKHGRVVPYDYVMKADDDTYFRVNQLVESLRPLARKVRYYGFTLPCKEKNPFHHIMSGMGYLLSWDLVEWISTSEVPRKHTVGPEDRLVGEWLERGHRGKNRYNAKPAMYDYPARGVRPDHCEGPFTPNTIAVHQLKTRDKWVDTFQRFNVTEKLRPSKLYYI